MIKFYQVSKRSKEASGFWSDAGSVYVDHIRIIDIRKFSELYARRDINFANKELAVFYVRGKNAYIDNQDGSYIKLEHQVIQHYKRLSIKIIKEWLWRFGGCTVFRIDGGYTVEAWK